MDISCSPEKNRNEEIVVPPIFSGRYVSAGCMVNGFLNKGKSLEIRRKEQVKQKSILNKFSGNFTSTTGADPGKNLTVFLIYIGQQPRSNRDPGFICFGYVIYIL